MPEGYDSTTLGILSHKRKKASDWDAIGPDGRGLSICAVSWSLPTSGYHVHRL